MITNSMMKTAMEIANNYAMKFGYKIEDLIWSDGKKKHYSIYAQKEGWGLSYGLCIGADANNAYQSIWAFIAGMEIATREDDLPF